MATILKSGMQAGLAVQRGAVAPLQRQVSQWRYHKGHATPQSKPAVTCAQGRGQQAANAAKKPVKAAQQTSLFQGLA